MSVSVSLQSTSAAAATTTTTTTTTSTITTTVPSKTAAQRARIDSLDSFDSVSSLYLSSGDESGESGVLSTDADTVPLHVTTPKTATTSSSSPLDAHFLTYFARDPYLLAHRGVYFFGMGANAAYYPFAVQLWVRKEGAGIDMALAGVVYAAGHVAAMVFSPLLSTIADRSERARRLVLVLGLAAQALAIILMSTANSFAAVLICQALIEGSGSAIWTGMDAATQRLLTVCKGTTSEYGNTRAFGALGWGIFALGYGFIFDKYGINYGYYLCGVTSIPAIVCACYVPLERRAASGAGRALAFKAIMRTDVILVLAIVLVTAILLQIVDVFRFPFLASIGASNALLGGSLTVTAVSEAPFFFVTSALLQRISLKSALCWVLAGYAIRFVYYAQIGLYPLEAPEWTLPAELLHGFTFALGWAAATQYVAVLLPPELGASAQGLLSAVQWGLGSALGSLGGGAIANAFGWRVMWRSFAALAAATLLLFLAVGKKVNPAATNGDEKDTPVVAGRGGAEEGEGGEGEGDEGEGEGEKVKIVRSR